MQLETIKHLIKKRDSLDPDTKEYEELSDEIKLLQNDLLTLEIMGEIK